VARGGAGRAGALALLAFGVALEAAAFPPVGFWPLGFVMLAPVAGFADRAAPRGAFGFAWLQQALAAALIVRWLLYALLVEYGAAGAPSFAFLALLVCSYAVVPAAAVALYARLAPRASDIAAPLLFAALFVLAEWLRAEPLQLPWVLAAQPFAFVPILVQGAELGGAYLPGFVVAAANAGLGVALARGRARPLVAPAALLALALGFGALRLAAPVDADATVRVGVVQASVPQRERFQAGSALRNTQHHIELTRQLVAAEPVDLVVWSETAVDDDLDELPELKTLLAEASRAAGAPLVTGAPRSSFGRRTNAVVLFDANGLRDSYDKQKLVPFAERDPALVGFVAPLLGPVTRGQPYEPGREARVLPGPLPFAAPICFEITDPALMRRFRAAGARLVLNLSNDAWFGRTGYAEMHLAHAVFRAVELRSWVVRGTNTGISAVIDPAGRLRARLGLFEEGTLVAKVGPAGAETVYARFGNAPVLAALALCAGATALTGAGRGAARGRSAARGRDARRGARRGGSTRSRARRRGA
jgi:apolipoprotein N-acyltransferase